MSALLTPHLSLEVEQERLVSLDPAQRCRFCQCSEVEPCPIPLREDADGNFHLASSEAETSMILPCSWFLPNVCSRPECIEKLLIEARGRVVLFDGSGRRMA
jgi:hypothetical protein